MLQRRSSVVARSTTAGVVGIVLARVVALTFAATFALIGCGQKGPLTLPAPPAAKASAPAASSPLAPAPAASAP